MLLAAALLAACSSGGDQPDTPSGRKPTLAALDMYIAVPQAGGGTRAVEFPGDPGDPAEEAADWDRLTIIVAYTAKQTGDDIYDEAPAKTVYYDTFTKSEFDCLNADGTLNLAGVEHASSRISPVVAADGTDTGYRYYTMSLPLGTVRVYGVTYSSACSDRFDLERMLAAVPADGADHNADIAGLQISNDYATESGGTLNASRFVSVATGYALNYRDASAPTPDLAVSKGGESEMRQYWSMTLHRLAVKLDIQWDAYGAYNAADGAYTDVAVSQFAYSGGAATDGGSGYGRLFPYKALHQGAWPLAAVGGTKAFVNQSAVSKRNGRVYHYLFPDGSADPRITFTLDTRRTVGGATDNRTATYTYVFGTAAPLAPATWYKVATSISGNTTAATTISIDKFITGN